MMAMAMALKMEKLSDCGVRSQELVMKSRLELYKRRHNPMTYSHMAAEALSRPRQVPVQRQRRSSRSRYRQL